MKCDHNQKNCSRAFLFDVTSDLQTFADEPRLCSKTEESKSDCDRLMNLRALGASQKSAKEDSVI